MKNHPKPPQRKRIPRDRDGGEGDDRRSAPRRPDGRADGRKGDDRKGEGRGFRPSPHRERDRERDRDDDSLPPVFVAEVTLIDDDGLVLAKPARGGGKVERVVVKAEHRRAMAGICVGDQLLLKTEKITGSEAIATLIRTLPRLKMSSMVGVVEEDEGSYYLLPASPQKFDRFPIVADNKTSFKAGAVVRAVLAEEPRGRRDNYRFSAPSVKVAEVLQEDASSVSLFSIFAHQIPFDFSAESIALCESFTNPVMAEGRVDLRHLPLVTIDGEDARDFDDAVFAERLPSNDRQPKTRAWHIVVAIADVSHYVRHGTALDDDAYDRGNSVYFPDRVVPMLPERLSNGLCSLRPEEDRYAMAMDIWLDAEGTMVDYRLQRALIRSRARLTYNQVQRAVDGTPDAVTAGLLDNVIHPLYAAYKLLLAERQKRGALEIESPEYAVVLDGEGKVQSITQRERLESHRLIEEFMILANIAAARLLQRTRMVGLYRNHDLPSRDKAEELRDYVRSVGYDVHVGANIHTRHFNELLNKVRGESIAPLIHQAVLRSQMQAFYGAERVGHFGLALRDYAHFTSPIRRYSDLIVHRALITGLGLGDDGISQAEVRRMNEIGEHLSTTERRAMAAEREAKERYAIMYLARHQGEVMHGSISGFGKGGMFITIPATGVDGYIPFASIRSDFYQINPRNKTARGRSTGNVLSLGKILQVRIEEANVLTNRLRLTWVDDAPAAGSQVHRPERRGKPKHFSEKPFGKRPEGKGRPKGGKFSKKR